MSKVVLTPLGEALYRVNEILEEATKYENLLDILKEIRKVELGEHEFVTGYAGAWRYQVKCKN